MRFCLCLLAPAATLGEARAMPPIAPPALGFSTARAIAVAQIEERLVPPMPIPNVERKTPPMPRSRPADAARRNATTNNTPRKTSEESGSAASTNSGAASLAAPPPVNDSAKKPPATLDIAD
jgi:hypothetical protein